VISRWVDSAAPVPAETAATATSTPNTDTLSGTARVAGVGALRIDGGVVRLDGLTMLDPAQTCQRADGTTWACGAAAKQALEKLVRRRTVTCAINGETDGVRSGTCRVDGQDLGAELVRAGHGFADAMVWASYSSDERAAQDANAGLWAGTAERPDEWRARVYQDAAAIAPGGCPIKGRTQRGNKVYLMPHDAEYARTAIRQERGERWFCSEGEAKDAGFAAR
jgi:endonuclease YncB( thermonuclease family)